MTSVRRVSIHEVVSEPRTWNPRTTDSAEFIRYIDISSINAAEKNFSDVSAILPQNAPSRARQIVLSGDVLVSTVRPNLNAVAMVPRDLDGATASTGFAVLRPDPAQLDSRYLFHWVRSPEFVRYLTARATGASYPAVTERVVRESTLPLPGLTEQRRLATMLDRADAVRHKHRERMRLVDELLRSTFIEMFGEPVKNPRTRDLPRGWLLVPVEAIAARTLNACAGGPFGSSLTRADYIPSAGVPVIRGTNLIAELPVFREVGFVFVTDEKAEELRRNVALPGDIVFTQRGTLGQVARIPLDAKYPKYIISQSQMKVTLDETVVDPTYFVHYFLSPRAVADLEARTLATGVPHINLSILREFLVVLPPLALQRRFATVASRLAVCRRYMESASRQSEKLARSLIQNAFDGNRETPLTL